MDLRILYEDAHLLVLYKPAGVPVQSAKIGVQDCESMLKNYLYTKNPEKGQPFLGLIHRLDQPVEGLLVFGKTRAATAALSRQVTDGKMKKRYLALCQCEGYVDNYVSNCPKFDEICGKTTENVEKSVDNWIECVDFLKKNGRENRSEIVPEKTPGGKKSVLYYQVLKQIEALRLVEIELLTGRHHQIRVQMAGMGTPLLGDHKYSRMKGPVETVDNFSIALCAYHLEFNHPKTEKHMEFKTLPENPAFSKFLEGISKKV